MLIELKVTVPQLLYDLITELRASGDESLGVVALIGCVCDNGITGVMALRLLCARGPL